MSKSQKVKIVQTWVDPDTGKRRRRTIYRVMSKTGAIDVTFPTSAKSRVAWPEPTILVQTTRI